MKDFVYVNDLIQWLGEGERHLTERILWIDQDYTIAVTIDIFAKTGFPISRKIVDIIDAISDGRLEKIELDPFAHKNLVKDENLSEVEKTIREKAWNLISTLACLENEPAIYQKNPRGLMIKEVTNHFNAGKAKGSRQEKNDERVTEKTIYTYLRRYWQRGKTINALLPDYCNSGGRGKSKTAGEKKRGRPRKYAGLPEIGEGRNIDESDKRIFRVSINLFYETSKRNPLKTAYKLMLKTYYVQKNDYAEA